MRPLLWTAAWIAVAVWSLLIWGGYAMVGIAAAVLRWAAGDDVPGFPVEPFSPTWLIDLVHGLGGTVLFGVWAVVALVILGATWLVTALFTRPRLPPLRRDGESLTDLVDRLARDAGRRER